MKKKKRITRCAKDILDEIELRLQTQTQADLAKEIGVHRVRISDCRRGASVSYELQEDLRDKLGLPFVERETVDIDPRFERVTRKPGYGKHHKRTPRRWTRSVRLDETQRDTIDGAIAASQYASFSDWFLAEIYPQFVEIKEMPYELPHGQD